MTKASDNIFPKVTFVEGSAPSSPSATDFHLYFDSSDHLLKWKNSAGTVTTIATGSALTDQGVFTYLDGTVAAAPGTPAAGKLRVYAKTGKVLAVKDDAGVETVLGAGGGSSVTASENRLTSDVNITAGTFADGPSLSLAAGTWVLDGYIEVEVLASNTWITARLMSASTAIDGRASFCETNTADESLYLGAVVVLGSTTTVKIQATTLTNNGVMRATAAQNNTGLTNLASYLRALKIA